MQRVNIYFLVHELDLKVTNQAGDVTDQNFTPVSDTLLYIYVNVTKPYEKSTIFNFRRAKICNPELLIFLSHIKVHELAEKKNTNLLFSISKGHSPPNTLHKFTDLMFSMSSHGYLH